MSTKENICLIARASLSSAAVVIGALRSNSNVFCFQIILIYEVISVGLSLIHMLGKF